MAMAPEEALRRIPVICVEDASEYMTDRSHPYHAIMTPHYRHSQLSC